MCSFYKPCYLPLDNFYQRPYSKQSMNLSLDPNLPEVTTSTEKAQRNRKKQFTLRKLTNLSSIIFFLSISCSLSISSFWRRWFSSSCNRFCSASSLKIKVNYAILQRRNRWPKKQLKKTWLFATNCKVKGYYKFT